MTVKVSICMPVYNGEKFIKKTLDSICNQTLKEYELIVVDDGSTDQSSQILEEYSSKFSAYKYIYQNNSGVSVARQTAVNNATGEFIAFIDADDVVAPETYEYLYNIATSNDFDIVELRADRNGELYNTEDEGTYVGKELILKYFVEYNWKRPLWLRMCRRELYNESIFPNFRLNNEDVFVTPCLLAKANKIFVLPKDNVFYSYVDDNPNSVVNLMRTEDEATYKKHLLFAKVPVHFANQLGFDDAGFCTSKEFDIFKGRFYEQILMHKFYENSFDECISDIEKAGNVNKKEIIKCIKKYYKMVNSKKYIAVLLLGARTFRKLLFMKQSK